MQLSKSEEEIVYQLAEKITGSSQRGRWRKTVLLQNVLRRIMATGSANLASYLDRIARDEGEYRQLVSALTIHFTSWFREAGHFDLLYRALRERAEGELLKPQLRILSAACSTGEEIYSLGLFLEAKRQAQEISDYQIVGFDLDPISVATAQRAIYPLERIADIPASYRRFCLVGSGRSAGFFTVDNDIRQRVRLFDADLRKLELKIPASSDHAFDAIICRNVLIYFDDKGVEGVVKNLVARLKPGGTLCLGHSEAIDGRKFGLEPRGHALYRTPAHPVNATRNSGLGRVLVVDDSNVVRRVLASIISQAGLEVHTVESAAAASQFLQEQKVDLITLDLKMPDLDGLTWLRAQRRQGMRLPVIIVSDSHQSEADDVLGALTDGAQDYIEKRDLSAHPEKIADKIRLILTHQQEKTGGKLSPTLLPPPRASKERERVRPEVILIGASTGGTEALASLLAFMPPDAPPVVVVQHITSAFAEAFSQRLARVSGLKLGSAKQDAVLEKGHVYLAQGDYHIGIKRSGGLLKLELSHALPEHSVRPAVDYLFRSAAAAKVKALAAVLTGMGKDGALGLLELKNLGCYTLAQDEASSVVYGMPREALALGAVSAMGDLKFIRREIDLCLSASLAKAV